MAEEATTTVLDTGTSGATDTAAAAAATAAATAATNTAAASAAAATAAPDWPADWRAKIAADDQTLARFASPKAMYESYAALRAKMSSGELKAVTPFPKDGTSEAQAEWRKGQGLPESPEKYDLTGLTIEESEKDTVSEYLKAAHANNLNPDQAKALLTTRATLIAAQKAKQAEVIAQLEQETSDALNAEMGADYRRNMNLVAGLLDSHGKGDAAFKESVMLAVKRDANFARFMTAAALAINPTATLFPAGTGGSPGGIESRLAELNKMMRTDRKSYNDPKISGPDGEYFKLLRAYENANGKPYAA